MHASFETGDREVGTRGERMIYGSVCSGIEAAAREGFDFVAKKVKRNA